MAVGATEGCELGSPGRLSATSLPPRPRPGAGGKALGLCGSRARVTVAMGGKDLSRG